MENVLKITIRFMVGVRHLLHLSSIKQKLKAKLCLLWVNLLMTNQLVFLKENLISLAIFEKTCYPKSNLS